MVASITSSFLLAFTPSIKTLESKMVSRSLVLNKILQKHMGNRSKNTKKIHQYRILKDTLRPKDKEFVETKE